MKVLIVEDEALVAEDLKDLVEELSHEVVGMASDVYQAIETISITSIDCVLLDIRLSNNSIGFDIANKLKSDFNIPFIFITAHSDSETLKKASPLDPLGYLIKPIRKENLFALLELLNNKLIAKGTEKPFFKVKKNGFYIELNPENVTHLQADGSYTKLFMIDSQVHLSTKSLKFLNSIEAFSTFVRVHKSFAVNPTFIISKNSSEIKINNIKIPIGRSYK